MDESRSLTPAERLRALELSGDPEAREIARGYKSSPMDPSGPAIRAVQHQIKKTTRMLAANFDRATPQDAAEAEERAATARAERESLARKREGRLFDIAEAGQKREKVMVTLTRVSVGASGASLLIAVAALIVAIVDAGS